ncbi:MAG: UDP-N-acetylmuramoyl-L-alanyl-D-glutamate--2,6-diaminopimelate ligase [Proteobacteria bacterium]|nr:UDP-N-acetylmuramoyl-L-alanyl-D-glutamate--2,6-diaminopimelate ligase [Pseudomonadota bacterium]
MNLASLIKENFLIPLGNNINKPTSISLNSKTVQNGGLFVAIPGLKHDGAAYVDEALQRGAVCIVSPQGVGEKLLPLFKDRYPHVSFFVTPEIRKTASCLAACFYPLQPDNIVAVTGTNGKTSVASFIRQIWGYLGVPAASLGTLGLIVEGRSLPPPTGTDGLNSPDPIKLHQILQSLKEEQINHLAFEASSHGLHQHRLDSVNIKAAVFTNFTNDHLDYHHTLEAYFEAKCRLFDEIMFHGTHAILNADMPEYEQLLILCQKRNLSPVTFGKAGQSIRLVSVIPEAEGQDVMLSIKNETYNFSFPLVGEFQVYNMMAALGAVIACDGNITRAIEACMNLKGVPGRLEEASHGVYVDYAHTPDGLYRALKALRPHTKGNLWVVFGCGGNRDALKRSLMGEVAAKLADKVIITDDNPRHEDASSIRQQILASCPGAQEIGLRREAISYVLKEKKSDDVVLIAGKGHETYQLVGDQVLPFNDVEEVQKGPKQ